MGGAAILSATQAAQANGAPRIPRPKRRPGRAFCGQRVSTLHKVERVADDLSAKV
jgi:hypothetical protein